MGRAVQGKPKSISESSSASHDPPQSALHQFIKKYAADTDYVMIHDAARPCLSQELIGFCLKAAGGHDGAIPVLPMKDTVYSFPIDRNLLFLKPKIADSM